MLLKMLPSCEVFAQASVKVPSMSQKEDCTYKIGFWKREKLLFSHGIGFFFFKGNLCDQGSGGKFSWQELKQMLSCFDFFPVAFLANWGKRN